MATKTAKTTPSQAGNPFAKIKQTSARPGGLEHVSGGALEVRSAVDAFKKVAGEIKRLEGEKAAQAGILETFGRTTFAERQMRNKSGNFIIDGLEDTVSFQYQNYSAGISADDYEDFCKNHGTKAAAELLEINHASVKFNRETLEEPGVMDKLVEALQTLPPELLDRLFTPATYAAVDDVFVRARAHAKTAGEYEALMASLRVKNFVKG